MDTEELKRELNIEDWIEGQGLNYKLSMGSSGMQIHLQECPACGKRNWKTYLNAETGVGNCFSCEERFNKLSFIKFVMGFGDGQWSEVFKAAEEALKEQGWRPARKEARPVAVPKAKLPMSFALPNAEGQNLVYLEDRGIDGELAKFFNLRMCLVGYWNFDNEDGTPGGQNFANRVIIPIFDLDGEFVTFQGRDVTGTSDRKYLFPKGLPGTGRFLFNGQNVHTTHRVCLGEGAFDVFAQKKAFDEDIATRDVVAIGSFGKHLSHGSTDGNDQLTRFARLKAKGVTEVTIMWDGSSDALVAALNAARLLKGIGLYVRIALLPKGKDPNEVDPSVVRECFAAAQPYTTMLDMKLRLRNPYA